MLVKKGKKFYGIIIAISIVMLFVFGSGLYYTIRSTNEKMFESAVSSLSGNLNLISQTVDQIVSEQVYSLDHIANMASTKDHPQQWISEFCMTDGMNDITYVPEDASLTEVEKTTGIPLKTLDFSDGKTIRQLAVAKSYEKGHGIWAYTMCVPVVKDGVEAGYIYAEYRWNYIERCIPKNLYDADSSVLILDNLSKQFVVRQDAISLDDFMEKTGLYSIGADTFLWDGLEQNQSAVFYQDIGQKEYMVYFWPVCDGAACLAGCVPTDSILREAPIVSKTIATVAVLVTAACAVVIITLWWMNSRRQKVLIKHQKEREIYNKQLCEALDIAQAANASKTVFLSNMSHDIRTPMNAIVGFSTLIEQDVNDVDKVKTYIHKIQDSSQHLLNLINEILDISKIESGNTTLDLNEFLFSDIIESVKTIMGPMADAKMQSLEISASENIQNALFIGDQTRIEQIILNLLSNANKYTPPGGKIRCCMTESDAGKNDHEDKSESIFKHIQIEVSDTGIGMTPEFMDRVFEPFTRAEQSTTNKVQGTGLGMAITKSLVNLMGGSIEVTSQAGKGSVFTVTLDLKTVKKSDDAACVDVQSEQINIETDAYDLQNSKNQTQTRNYDDSIEGLSFLIAEDNALNAEIIETLLTSEGATCDLVDNGQAVVDQFKASEEGTYNVILMDVMMPVMNGYEATEAIRQMNREDAKTIPIVAMTANAFSEDVRNAIKSGMNAHLAKPLNMQLLKKTIISLLENNK